MRSLAAYNQSQVPERRTHVLLLLDPDVPESSALLAVANCACAAACSMAIGQSSLHSPLASQKLQVASNHSPFLAMAAAGCILRLYAQREATRRVLSTENKT
jgi:hypothetical protein